MPITLIPPLDTLGIAAPLLGPWFRGTSVTLPAPATDGELGLTLDLGAGATAWLPPAAGTLSLFVADPADPPLPIAHLQDAVGDWPFAAGRLVAWFRLLPEVEERLHELSRLIPAATGAALTAPPATPFAINQRARVRGFALVPTLASFDHDGLMPLIGGTAAIPGASTNRDRLIALGLDQDQNGLVNGEMTMTRLRRPGRFTIPPSLNTEQDTILEALTGQVELWAFDHRGRAIDPGAVAAWWSWLLDTGVGAAPGGADPQLLAPGLAGTLPQANGRAVLCPVDPARTVHLVDAHEGPLGEPFLDDRLQQNGAAVSARLVRAASDALAFAIRPLDPPPAPPAPQPPADDPPLDSAPLARIAALPAGPYAASVTLWPGGQPSVAGLERDFLRVAVLDAERQLTGLGRRGSREAAGTPDERRRSDQNRPSTRIAIGRTSGTAPVLLATAEESATALDAVAGFAGPLRAVLGIADAESGPAVPGLLATSGAPYPVRLTEDATLANPGSYRVRALAGGGAADGAQAVLLEATLGAAHDGAWLRAWPLGFALETGTRPRLTGGGGRVAGGRATAVLTLPAGQTDAAGLLSFDAQLSRVDAAGEPVTRLYADCRFARPAALAGDPATTIAGAWVICETGQTGSGALPEGVVPPGASVVLTGDPAAMVDRAAVPAAARTADTLVNRVVAGDIVSLTEPAYLATPDKADALGRPVPREGAGDARGGFAAPIGNGLHRLSRGPASAGASSAPLALQDRLEVAAASVAGTAAAAMLSGGARLPDWHEQLPHFLGHPGARAGVETHATGVLLDGPAALGVAEYVRERTAGLGFTQVSGADEPLRSIAVQSELAVAAEAVPAFPALPAPAGPGPLVAILRTTSRGQEGLPGAAVASTALAAYPVSEHGSALQDWLDDLVTLPAGLGPLGAFLRGRIGTDADAIARALDRRLNTAIHGAREATFALAAAIGRAQDFVYVETPAFDGLDHGPDDDRLNLLDRLLDRLVARPGLRVLLCVPSRLGRGTPRALARVRDAALTEAMADLRRVAGERVALFSPGAGAGRALRLATTTVIVDDAFALTGTTHLWRRGLTFDSSLAASLFDERVADGRCQEIAAFRRRLIAGRLGLAPSRLTDDPDELVRAVRELDAGAPSDDFGTQPSQRRSATPIVAPDPAPTDLDIATWNPDGSRDDLDLAALLGAIALTSVDQAVPDD